MKNILCYGDSNTWGYIAGSMNPEFMLAERLPYEVRWTGILQNLLGSQYHLIEAGLNGRTTAFDEVGIVRASRNGLSTLPGILDMHYPLDLVIFMLGTNDVKTQFKVSPAEVTHGMRQLIHYVKSSHLGPQFSSPEVMLIAPAPIVNVGSPLFKLFYDEASVAKSEELAQPYQNLAEQEKCMFLNAGPIVKISMNDGVHYEPASHKTLAAAIKKKISA